MMCYSFDIYWRMYLIYTFIIFVYNTHKKKNDGYFVNYTFIKDNLHDILLFYYNNLNLLLCYFLMVYFHLYQV